jgi:hypothetical protein
MSVGRHDAGRNRYARLASATPSDDEVRIEQARVTWARNHEFGIELKHLSAADHHWLMKFVDRTERRSTFHRMPTLLPSEEELSLVPLSLPLES